MADAVNAYEATLVGGELPDESKWSGGVLAADGNIYGIPLKATQVLRFDPRTQQATLVGAELPGNIKWSGGVMAADGNIYGIPYDATQVLRFDPSTQEATLVGDQLPGDAKWSGGVLAADGNIYGIPCHATQVLRFDPRTQQATRVGDQLPGGTFKWLGGVLAADGSIYGIPYDATQVLRFTMTLPEATADLVLELDKEFQAYVRLEQPIDDVSHACIIRREERKDREDALEAARKKVKSAENGGLELLRLLEDLQRGVEAAKNELDEFDSKPLRLPARGSGAHVRLIARGEYQLGMGQVGISVRIERKSTGGGDGSMVVLHTAHATYSLQLPEERFGIEENSSYAPMMDAHERECLARLCPFADGNPRRLKRIINVFNVGRRVVELRRGKEWPGLAEFKPKLLKFVIMLEQWPYRTAWLLQLIEDLQQSQAFHETCKLELHEGQAAKIPEAGAFFPRLLEHAGLLETYETPGKTNEAILELNVIIVYKKLVQGLIYSPPDCDKYLALDADPQDFERLLMVKPLLTVRDFRTPLSDEVADAGELLRNYEFNISQGIVQRVSRFFDALALIDERGEAPPASAGGGVMGFGRKRNVGNQEKKPARRVAWEQQKKERSQKEAEEAAAAAALKAAEQDTKLAALEVKVAAAAAREAAEQSAEVAALKAQVAAAAALKAAEQEKMAALKEEVAALKAAEQDTKIAALKAQVAEMQAMEQQAKEQRAKFQSFFEPTHKEELAARRWF